MNAITHDIALIDDTGPKRSRRSVAPIAVREAKATAGETKGAIGDDEAEGGYVPVACTDYDVLELACVDDAELELVLDDGVVAGTALTLENDGNAEYLVLRQSDGATSRVRIDRIGRLVVRSRPARFEAHDFGAR